MSVAAMDAGERVRGADAARGAQRRIALVHATAISVDPVLAAFAAGWPEAVPVNILDDGLALDRAKTVDLTDGLNQRIVDIAQYARSGGAEGILFTCSAFGGAIDRAAALLDIPVLKPNEAMFDAAIKHGGRIAMIATFPPARAGMEQEFAQAARRLRSDAIMTSFVVEPALIALKEGNVAGHNELVVDQARRLDGFDAIVLAHFSTARAATAVRDAVPTPVFTSPDAAVAKLRRLLVRP